uniref:Uncharacterized protein n=1 Tax=viral metagenome TaxID=1070528 RepID=A0A6M3LDU9_9ZZZZ
MPTGMIDSIHTSVTFTREQKEWIQSLPDELIWFHAGTPTEYAVTLMDWWFRDMPEETIFWQPPTGIEYKAAVKRLKLLAAAGQN